MKTIYTLVLAAVLAVSALAAVSIYFMGSSGVEIDDSWIAKVEADLEAAKPFPEEAGPPIEDKVYLIEAGQKRYVGEKTEFSLYLRNLVLDVNYRRGSISAEEVDEVLSKGRVVQYAFRIAETSEKWNYLSCAYCVLEDNSGMDLKGYFISKETGEGTTQYGIWAYPKN